MTRFGFLLTALSACAYAAPVSDATFHGTVGEAVTHVMAVSPVAGDLVKVVAPTEAGSFSVTVEPGRPWAFVFLDTTRRGAGMVHGILRSDTLDTFIPAIPGDVDLGDISVDNHEATMAGSGDSLDQALGVTRGTLATLGGIDDIALRYANPDIDGDGMIDVDQGIAPRLEVHAEYTLHTRGRDAIAKDFIVSAEAVTYKHVGTGIYGRLPDSFGTVDRGDSDVSFAQPYYGYWPGDATAAVPGGHPVSHLTYGDDRTLGVFCRPDHPIPSGTYTFRSGPHTLDFSFVRPPTEMTMNQVMPRIQFVPSDYLCTRDCKLDKITFAWARKTDTGWITLTDEEATVLRPVGSLDFVFDDGVTRRYEFPIGYATGEVPWHHPIYTTQHDYGSGNIVYGSLAFQSRPGMKMYARFGGGNVASKRGLPQMD